MNARLAAALAWGWHYTQAAHAGAFMRHRHSQARRIYKGKTHFSGSLRSQFYRQRPSGAPGVQGTEIPLSMLNNQRREAPERTRTRISLSMLDNPRREAPEGTRTRISLSMLNNPRREAPEVRFL